MKYLKHHTNSNSDGALSELILQYGMKGYGLYWYILEQIGSRVALDKLTWKLELSCKALAVRTMMTEAECESIIKAMGELELIEFRDGDVYCPSLEKHADQYTGRMINREKGRLLAIAKKDFKQAEKTWSKLGFDMDELYSEFKCTDNVRTIDAPTTHQLQTLDAPTTHNVHPEEKRIEENRVEESRVETNRIIVPKNKFSVDDMITAEWLWSKIEAIKPNAFPKKPNLEKWADTIRLMVERDNRTHKEICTVYNYVRNDEFWRVNILSPEKLREQFPKLLIKMDQSATSNGTDDALEKWAANE